MPIVIELRRCSTDFRVYKVFSSLDFRICVSSTVLLPFAVYSRRPSFASPSSSAPSVPSVRPSSSSTPLSVLHLHSSVTAVRPPSTHPSPRSITAQLVHQLHRHRLLPRPLSLCHVRVRKRALNFGYFYYRSSSLI